MVNLKKSLSVITSAAIATSVFSAFAVTASAKDEIVSENFNDSSTIGSYWEGSGNAGCSTANGTLTVTGVSSGARNRTITLDSNTGNSSYAEVDLDFNVGNYGYALEMAHGFSMKSSSGQNIMTFNFPNSQYSTSKVTINGAATNVDTVYRAYTGWYTLKTVLNFDKHTFDYTITAQGSDDVVSSGADIAMETEAENMGSLYFITSRHVNPIYVDNFYLASLEGPELEITPYENNLSVNVGEDVTAAQYSNAESVAAESADTGIAEVSVNDGVISVTGVSPGKTDISISVASADGVVLRDTIEVVVGNVSLADVNVKYVDSDYNEIQTGYVIASALVGSVIEASSVTIPEKIETAAYRYTNASASDYTVVNGENTFYVVYSDKAAAVTSFTVNYISDNTVVASKTESIGAGYYSGDEYTYISTAYVIDENDAIYAIGTDYTTDTESPVTLNNSSVAVNSVLKQTVTLSADTVLVYNAVSSPNAVYYSEWEDILGVSPYSATTNRYMVSGGKYAATTSTTSFYEIPANGYYQIVYVGGQKKRGTAIFANRADADAATAYDDEKALISVKGDNNDAYGILAVKTALFTEGDNLTLRGFNAGNNSTDHLDYIVIRHLVSGNVIGSDGVSIIPGGQTAEYSFDTDLPGTVEWTVEGVNGVTIDENGVLTVSESASEGTAVVRAEIETAGVSGSKAVTIAKAQVADFTFNAPAVISLGSEKQYSYANVVDQFGTDVTSVSTVEYSSTDSSVISIDPTTGIALASGMGTADISAAVRIGNAQLLKTQTVTVNKLYIAGEADGNTTTVDSADLVTSDSISGYRITTAKNGAIVNQYDEDEIPETIDTTGADSYEIDPIYTYNSLSGVTGAGYTAPDMFADGFYNMTFTKGDTKRADIYVNDYMVGNNVDQYGPGRTISSGAEYTIHDAVVTGGSIKISTTDLGGNGSISKAVIVKAPSNVNRKKKVYIIGDSLVADYYGDYDENTVVGGARTGWGQVINNFFNDEYEVVNLANSGAIAKGLYQTAFPGIENMAQPGDYFIAESGYNDSNPKNNTSREELYSCIVAMVEKCEEMGVHSVIVSPNASQHDFKSAVQYASTMTQAGTDMMAAYDDVIYVDLSRLSYEFMVNTGISTVLPSGAQVIAAVKNADGTLASASIVDSESLKVTEWEGSDGNFTFTENVGRIYAPIANADGAKYYWNSAASMTPVATEVNTQQVALTYNLVAVQGDRLHSSYAGAMKWAEIVAQGMKDAGADFINTDFSYKFTDTIGNEITCQVK